MGKVEVETRRGGGCTPRNLHPLSSRAFCLALISAAHDAGGCIASSRRTCNPPSSECSASRPVGVTVDSQVDGRERRGGGVADCAGVRAGWAERGAITPLQRDARVQDGVRVLHGAVLPVPPLVMACAPPNSSQLKNNYFTEM